MAYANYFAELWDLDWGVGIFSNPPIIKPSYILITGFIPHEYFFYVSPLTSNFVNFDLEDIEIEFKKLNRPPAIYLTEKHQQAGFVEHLIRHGYQFHGSETWVAYDPSTYQRFTSKTQITEITKDTYSEFRVVADEVFAKETTQKEFSDLCYETLLGTKIHPGVNSKFFAIYEDVKLVSTGAIFYSQKDNFAYFHSDSTLDAHRGKGYQKALISFRTELALSLDINRIYAIVERGSQSWANYLKLGFNEIQTLLLLKKSST